LGVRIAAAAIVAAAVAAAPAQAQTYAKGVDVSHYQGVINWAQVAGASIRFTFAKATEGTTYVDATYPVNRAGAEGMGIRFGAYHFGRPEGTSTATIVGSAIAQADHLVDVAQPQPGELPPVLDLEVTGGLGAEALAQWAQAFLEEVKARTGVSGFVYSSPNFWKNKVGDTGTFALAGYRLWVAHWTANASPSLPAANWGGLGWTFWQYTDCAKIPGFLNCVDADRFSGPDPSTIAIAPYPSGAPVSSVPPTVVGVVQVGKVLTAVPGTWGGGKPVAFTYQWQRCDGAGAGCAPIQGATGDTYKPIVDDVGHALVAAVPAQGGGGALAVSSPPTVAIGESGAPGASRPVATSLPVISGTAVVGQQLTASAGTWTGSPTAYAYQWRRCDATGASCGAITGATMSTYTITPGDIGSTISFVVTATSTGGSQTATATATGVVAAAPVPPAVQGSLVAVAGQAGAVVTTDGRATVSWQPGAVPDGSTVTLVGYSHPPALTGTPVSFGVTGATALAWPADITYATPPPSGMVVGYSTDGKVWLPAATLASAALPTGAVAGLFNDGTTTHVLVGAPVRIAVFAAGKWGDPSLIGAGPPTVSRNGALQVKRLADGSVSITARVSVVSQAHLYVGLVGSPQKQSLLLRPGVVPVRVRAHLKHGVTAHLRVAAVDPWGRKTALVLTFRAP
jgi:GH25 family lysozyme M1 (1,4-beta-N-acetylmuramidase)